MAILTATYSANTAITFDISGLGTSSSFVAGRESTEINNSVTLYMDAIVNVRPIAGHAVTAPVVGQYIGLWVWGADTSLATNAIDVLDGLDSAETLSHAAVLNSLKMVAAPAVTVITPVGLLYPIMPFSVAKALDLLVLPKFWGLYLAHNHVGALAAAQSTRFSFNGISYTST